MWTPEDGQHISGILASSILRILSVKGPVALIIAFALTSNSSPVTSSFTRTPLRTLFPSWKYIHVVVLENIFS